MHQKYVIYRDGANSKLKISEYAILDKIVKNAASSMAQMGKFSFLCEETYESEIIEAAITKGRKALLTILRTQNIFPIKPYAIKIAESVIALYNSSEDSPVELLFNDVDLVSV